MAASVSWRCEDGDGVVDQVLERLDALDLLQVPRAQADRLLLDGRGRTGSR